MKPSKYRIPRFSLFYTVAEALEAPFSNLINASFLKDTMKQSYLQKYQLKLIKLRE
jgi:hypothetical protein